MDSLLGSPLRLAEGQFLGRLVVFEGDVAAAEDEFSRTLETRLLELGF